MGLLPMALTAAIWAAGSAPTAQDRARAELGRQFEETVRPFVRTYCTDCHGRNKPKGQLDLSALSDLQAVVRQLRALESVADMLQSREMPPDKAKRHPTEEARGQVLAWIQALRRHEAGRRAGDPGPVLARRLSHAEYDYTIRDLTGVDIRPAREFPVDPANEAGFDNSGESLVMSSALLKKYLDAARTVAEHLVLTPRDLVFGTHPVLTDTDRDRYAASRIAAFYERQPTDLAPYFLAAWRFQHRAALGRPAAGLAALAAQGGLGVEYLHTVWGALQEKTEGVGPLAKLQALFRALPSPPDEKGARQGSEGMRDFVQTLRAEVAPRFANLRLPGVSAGSQPFVLWKNTQRATHRTACPKPPLHVLGAPPSSKVSAKTVFAQASLAMSLVHFSFRNIVHDSALPVPFAVHELKETFSPPNADLGIPDEASRSRYEAAFARFCQVFPDAFYVAERGRTHLDQPKDRKAREEKGRLLSAGFHNMFGYFRDDLPLYQRILDARGRRELDALWRELDFITLAPVRQQADFLFYERGESGNIRGPAFDFVRAEDKQATSPAGVRRLGRVYVARARENLQREGSGDPRALPVLEAFFRTVAANISRVERQRRAAEPAHLAALLTFAERAWRRPLARSERTRLLAFYRSLRKEGTRHEGALRDAVVRVLMSPNFLYRLNAGGVGVRPLNGHELASRLSYFLWSSMPDQALLRRARRGDLDRPEVLVAETRRMLRDERARALAVEFGGQWLDFRRFEEHNAVDRARFPTFDDELRRAMFEEPVRFFSDVIEQDRPVLDFLYAADTFVNAPLAKHYGMSPLAAKGWVRVEDARVHGRGGLLPMAVFLTKNAPGRRTSPVKRGYWLVRHLLGERIPAPPAQVPDLPADEKKMGALTLRQMLAEHRKNEACAGCHARFDSFGLAFEGYGPIGERRTHDLGGRPVDSRATFPGGGAGKGVEGVRVHLRAHRQKDFLENLCRKLLAYALGRTLIPSDDATVANLRARLSADGHRFGSLVSGIVTSPQFLNKRGGDELAQN